MVWRSSDGLLSIERPSLTEPLLVTRRDGGGSFVYDPIMDSVDSPDGGAGDVAGELRAQLDEIRGTLFGQRRTLGLPLSLAEVLWRPRIYLHVWDGVFIVPVLVQGDTYPREVRYGECDVDRLLSLAEPYDSLVFDGFQAADGCRWVRRDGCVTPVVALSVARAPLSSSTRCTVPWLDARVDGFLSRHDRDGWETLFLP